MRRRMLTKLISIVCAAALATSCAAMSVGAVPIQISQADWVQGHDIANALLERAEEVGGYGCVFEDCIDLADEIEEFLNGTAYNALFSEISDETKVDFLEGFYNVLDSLRSDDLKTRKIGIGAADNYLSHVLDLMEEHIN